jgi:outer membrane protein assembly factor BamB
LWGVAIPGASAGADGGAWATPALGDGVLYLPTHAGELLTVSRDSGEVLDRQDIGPHAWSSPALVGDRLLVGTCIPGGLRTYSVADPTAPAMLGEHRMASGGCIESTPAVWNGQIVIGSRDGFLYKFE